MASPRAISVLPPSDPWPVLLACTAQNTSTGVGSFRPSTSKKVARKPVGYLEKDELDALLKGPDCRTAQGRRDYTLLLFMYSTRARAYEVARGRIT